MVIFNNMAAMSALNEMNRNNGKLGKMIKNVSSGMRINSAGDDAAGLSISEKMRVRIRALSQCNENSVKGQDLIDTASAAVDEQVNIMKQVKTIALRATDGTYTDKDRGTLQKEVSQLLDQSEDIANTTFNSIQLLNKRKLSKVTKYFDPNAPYRPNINNTPVLAQAANVPYTPQFGEYKDIGPSTNLYDASGNLISGLPAVGTQVATTSGGTLYNVVNNPFSNSLAYWVPGGSKSITELNLSGLNAAIGGNVPSGLDGLGFSFDCGGCNQFVTVMLDADTFNTTLYQGKTDQDPMCYVIGVRGVSGGANFEKDLAETIFNGINAATEGRKGKSLPSNTDTFTTVATRHDIQLKYYAATGKIAITKDGPEITLMNGNMGAMRETNGFRPEQDLYLQTGDRGSQNTKITLPNTTLSILFPASEKLWDIEPEEKDYPTEWPKGYDALSDAEKRTKWKNEVWQYPSRMVNLDVNYCVSSRERANRFLGDVDQAIKYLLNANTTLGAQSNRLDYTEDNIVVMHENTTAAESVLRDADMAKSVVEHAKYNLLTQASQSMLAQANQMPQGVLSLLQ